MQVYIQIGEVGTEVMVDFRLDEEDGIDWETLKVYLEYQCKECKVYDKIDVTDLMNEQWSAMIEEHINLNIDKIVREELDKQY